jgi:hypothetical protein
MLESFVVRELLLYVLGRRIRLLLRWRQMDGPRAFCGGGGFKPVQLATVGQDQPCIGLTLVVLLSILNNMGQGQSVTS